MLHNRAMARMSDLSIALAMARAGEAGSRDGRSDPLQACRGLSHGTLHSVASPWARFDKRTRNRTHWWNHCAFEVDVLAWRRSQTVAIWGVVRRRDEIRCLEFEDRVKRTEKNAVHS
jgi:hypothetical protein